MEEEVVIIELSRIEDTLREPVELRFEALRAHQVRQLDMVKAVVIWHIGGCKLDPGQAGQEQNEQDQRNDLLVRNGCALKLHNSPK